MRVTDRTRSSEERLWLRCALVAVLGLALGIVSATHLLVGSGLVLIPWGLVAVLIGATARSSRHAVRISAAYGFSVAFAFAVAGYDSEVGLAERSWFFAVLGVLGAAGSVLGAVLGYRVTRRLRG